MWVMWDNEIDKYTLSSSTAAANFPASHLQDTRLVMAWRSTQKTAQYILIDAGVGNTITASCVAIARHNLTSGATRKIQANSSNSWSSPPVDESIAHDADIMTAFFTQSSYRFWRFYFDDSANPASYIEIGRLHLGTYLQMPPIEPTMKLPHVTTSRVSESPSGQAFGDRGYIFRNPGFQFPIVTESERSGLESLWAGVENFKPFFLLIWENSLDVVGPIYSRLDQGLMDFEKAQNGLDWRTVLQFREVF